MPTPTSPLNNIPDEVYASSVGHKIKGFFRNFHAAATVLRIALANGELNASVEKEPGALNDFFGLLQTVEENLHKLKSQQRPFVVVVEGLDGTGKSTLVKTLARDMSPPFRGIAVSTPTRSMDSIRPVFDLRGGSVARAFYMASNYVLQYEMYLLAEEEEHIVFVVDRWFSSTCAYSIGWKNTQGGPESVDALDESLFVWPRDLMPPNVMMLLQVDNETRRERVSNRGSPDKDDYSPWDNRLASDENLGRRIMRCFERIKGPRKVVVVDANQSKASVATRALAIVTEEAQKHFLPWEYYRCEPLKYCRWSCFQLGLCNESGERIKHTPWHCQLAMNLLSNGCPSLTSVEILAVNSSGILFIPDESQSQNSFFEMDSDSSFVSIVCVLGDYPDEVRWSARGLLLKISMAERSLTGSIATSRFVPFYIQVIPNRRNSTKGVIRHEWWRRASKGAHHGWSSATVVSPSSLNTNIVPVAMPVTLAISGAHCAGKRTLGKKLADILGWDFDPELGDVLRNQQEVVVDAHKSGYQGSGTELDWDEYVHTEECKRDSKQTRGNRVVETWHVGNLAWALLRDGSMERKRERHDRAKWMERARAAIETEMQRSSVLCVHLRTTVETTMQRRKLPENSQRVPMRDEHQECALLHQELNVGGEQLLNEFQDLHLPVLVMDNDEEGAEAIEKSVQKIVSFVNDHHWRRISLSDRYGKDASD